MSNPIGSGWHVVPASQTGGWGLCVSDGREIVARIPGRGGDKREQIARLIASIPRLAAAAREAEAALAYALNLAESDSLCGHPLAKKWEMLGPLHRAWVELKALLDEVAP